MTDGQTDGRGETLNAAHREGSIIVVKEPVNRIGRR